MNCERFIVLHLVMAMFVFSRVEPCDLQCKFPQPHAFRVQKLLHTSTQYEPPQIVLYRCDDESGCCGAESMCQMLKSIDVNVTLYKKFRPNDHGTIFTLSNHTECRCGLRTHGRH